MKIAVGFDRRGERLRSAVVAELTALGHDVVELAAREREPDGYAEPVESVALAVLHGVADRGVVVTRSGVGASFVANKIDGIHAGAGFDTYAARRGAEYGMNVLCLGAGQLGRVEAAEIVRAFAGVKPPRSALRVRHLAPLAIAGAEPAVFRA